MLNCNRSTLATITSIIATAVFSMPSLGESSSLAMTPDFLVKEITILETSIENKLLSFPPEVYFATTLLFGQYIDNTLFGMQFDLDIFPLNTRFCSVGISRRAAIGPYIIGLYGFVDRAIQDIDIVGANKPKLRSFNIGLEGMIKRSHLSLNTYIPQLEYYDMGENSAYSSGNIFEKVNIKTRRSIKNGYLKNANIAADINLRHFFIPKIHQWINAISVSLGGCVFHQKPVEQTEDSTATRWIVGGVFTLDCQFRTGREGSGSWNGWMLYTKIHIDNADSPLSMTLGVQIQTSSRPLCKYLGEVPIQRYV